MSPSAAAATLPGSAVGPLEPYVPRLVVDWLRDTPNDTFREVEGSLAFVDISGFTVLTERLARRGKVGAEEMSQLLNQTFGELLAVAYRDGAGLVKWGGDAVLLLFQGEDHAARASRAAFRMRATMRQIGKLDTSAGRVVLRMSIGVHSGTFHFFLVGDPAIHRELLISGPAASRCADLEALADAGQIAISHETAALLPKRVVGAPKGDGLLLGAQPKLDDLVVIPRPSSHGLDIGSTLPVAIREHLLAATGDAEHRQIAVAFVQFSGTDALLAEQGPAALAAALDEAMRNVQEATSLHEVTFFETDINRDGGKVMLTAGAPRSSGHDEERMLRAARRIMDRIGVLPLRIGINRGPVFAGDFGPEFRRTFSVKGDAINLAARVMGKAKPGQVLATRAVVDRSRTTFEVEDLPPFMVKGKSMPVDALSIGAVAGERIERATSGPLIGREVEMATLTGALDSARARRGTLVELVGEPGIGKSRLVAELRATAEDVTTVTAACDEYESSTAYFPFRKLLRDSLGLPREVPDELAVQRMVDRATVNAPHLLEWLPLVAVVLDVEMAPTPATANLDEQFRKARLEQVTAEFLALVLPTATLLVFDDVHLMDDASAELLTRLASDVAARPWMLLVTRRDQPSGYVPAADSGIVSVRPAPLDAAQALGLVAEELADSPLPPHEMAALAERAGGNPLFLRGLVLAARTGASLDALPDSVEALITSQIDRLPPDERTVLRYASVLGVQFHEGDLRAILEGHALPTGRSALARLAHFVQPAGHGRYRFEHALIRDAAYEGLPYRRRQELHGRVGEHVESRAADPEDVSELLSLHYFHAGRWDRAWHYSRVAGDRAREKFASVEAVGFFRRAVEVSRRLPDVDVDTRVDVLEALGDAQTIVGTFTDAHGSYRTARKVLGRDPVRSATLLRKEALLDQRLGRLTQAMRTLSRAMTALESVEGVELDPTLRGQRAQLQAWYAWCRLKQGRLKETIRWALRAEADAEAVGDREALANAYDALFAVYLMLGRTPPKPYGTLALDLFTELDDLLRQAACLIHLGYSATVQGRGDDALGLYSRARDAYTRAGEAMGAAAAEYNIADLLVYQGRLAEAEAIFGRILPVFQSLRGREWVASTRRELGRVAVRSGRVQEGAALMDEARAEMAELGLEGDVVETDAVRVEVTLARGQWEQALTEADETLVRARALDSALAIRQLQHHRGTALRALGRLDEARVALQEALEACAEEGQVDVGRVLVELAALARDAHDPAAEDLERRGREALTLLGWAGA
jgi:class 3 adenylate cyclase/tetratricopeptide (TPR) repeat protein